MTNTSVFVFVFFSEHQAWVWEVEKQEELSMGVRFLTWSTAEWVVVPFPELQDVRTGQELYYSADPALAACCVWF